MRKGSRWLCLILAAGMLVASMPLSALAADYTYISSISIKVNVELEAGDEIDDGDDISIGNGSGSGTYVYTSGNQILH